MGIAYPRVMSSMLRMKMNCSSCVTLDRLDHGIALITLNSPPLNLNTLHSTECLAELCQEISADKSIRVVVVTGAGSSAFCAGSDIHEFAEVRDDVVERKSRNENRAFTLLETLPMPVIAAINGSALGGGAEIALACDLRFMDEKAKIGFPEVRLGVFPGSGGTFRLPRIVGQARAYELMYSGDLITAQRAYEIGLVNRLSAAGACLSDAIDFATRLSKRSALALSVIKAGVRDSFLQSTEQATHQALEDTRRVFSAVDIEEGISAFFDKREPVFQSARDGKRGDGKRSDGERGDGRTRDGKRGDVG